MPPPLKTPADEMYRRRQAVRWYLRDVPFTEICLRLDRHSSWLTKWLKRFREEGWDGLHERSRRPHRFRAQTSPRVVDEVLAIRSTLESFQDRDVAIGAAAIQRILRRRHRRVPSVSTIERILRRNGTGASLERRAS
jgi:transposase